MFQQRGLVDMLREHITRVLRSEDFGQGEILLPQSVLNPEVGSSQMPDFAETSPPCDSDRGGGIAHNPQFQRDA